MAKYTKLEKEDLQKITHNYDLLMVEFEPIEGGAANSSYLLHTQQGKFVLTIFEEKALSNVLGIGKLLLLLAKYNFSTTTLLTLSNGEIALTYRDKPIILKTYLKGRVCEHLDEDMLYQTGVAIARLHQIPSPIFLPSQHSYGHQIFSRIIGRNINPEYESWLAKKLDYFKQNIPLNLPCGLIHGDIFYDNLLFNGTKLRAIIDFEEACYYFRVFDLGMAIVGLCTKNKTFALDKISSLITGYQQVQKLEDVEKKNLQLFVEYAATATSFWRFWKYNVENPCMAKSDRYIQMMHLAEEISVIPKTVFLSAVS